MSDRTPPETPEPPEEEILTQAQSQAELVIDQDEEHLAALGERFIAAMDSLRQGDVDRAAEELGAILKAEPRLAEPRIELARILLDTDQADEAAEQAQEAIKILEGGGQWTQDLPEEIVLSVAWDIRGEALRQQADRDEVVFGDPAEWQRLVEEARQAFQKAAALDPDNAHASYWAGGTDAERMEAEAAAADGSEGDGEGDDDDPVGILPGT